MISLMLPLITKFWAYFFNAHSEEFQLILSGPFLLFFYAPYVMILLMVAENVYPGRFFLSPRSTSKDSLLFSKESLTLRQFQNLDKVMELEIRMNEEPTFIHFYSAIKRFEDRYLSDNDTLVRTIHNDESVLFIKEGLDREKKKCFFNLWKISHLMKE